MHTQKIIEEIKKLNINIKMNKKLINQENGDIITLITRIYLKRKLCVLNKIE